MPDSQCAVPLLVRIGDAVTPSALRRARFFADLLAHPPRAPHPFALFIDPSAAPPPVPINGTTAASSSSSPLLRRAWVEEPPAYLSRTAERIAALVTQRALVHICGECVDPSSFDIHVRFLPSPAREFCACVVVREAAALRQIAAEEALLRAQYTATAALGQTVHSAAAFWHSVALDAAVENNNNNSNNNNNNNNSSEDAAQRTCVLGRAPARAAAGLRAELSWRQPPAAAGAARQSTAGLVAVLYLSFEGVLYAADINNNTEKEIVTETERRTGTEIVAGTETEVRTDAEAVMEEPFFFLPCAASTSFVRGVLGL